MKVWNLHRFLFAMALVVALVGFQACGGSDDDGGDIDGGDTDVSGGDQSSGDNPDTGNYPPAPYGKDLGDTFANFTLKDCDGNEVSLSDYYGTATAILISHAAGWCTNCRREAPKMNQWYEEYKDDGFVVIQPLNQDNSGNVADADFCKSWRDQYSIEFPVLIDADNLLAYYHPDPSQLAMPMNILLNGNMEITYLLEGDVPDSLEDQIVSAMEE